MSSNLGSCIDAGSFIRAGDYLAAPRVTVGPDSFIPYELIMQYIYANP